jgi:hypothetical protein
LTAGEVETLIEAAKTNRYGHRDATMTLIAFRHGLRACGYALANREPIPGRSRDGWGTARSRARPRTRLWRRIDSRISGESDWAQRFIAFSEGVS